MPGPARLDELTARLRAPDPSRALVDLAHEVVPGQTGPADRIVALAWATPDLGQATASASLPFKRVARDRLLGGHVSAVRYGPVQLLLEEPDDEGRISAYLSRYGPGVAAMYLERPRFLPPSHASAKPPRPVRTPFGRRGWLTPHEWPWGPFVVALEMSDEASG
jgi:hypothetical protein